MITIKPIEGSSDIISVTFPYDKKFVELRRAVTSRRWHNEEKIWSIPKTPTALRQTMQNFAGQGLDIHPNLEYLLKAANGQVKVKQALRDRYQGFTKRNQKPEKDELSLAKQAAKHMRMRNYSSTTIKTYKNAIADSERHFEGSDISNRFSRLTRAAQRSYNEFTSHKRKLAVIPPRYQQEMRT